jgi:hypothetical protein
MTDSEPRAAVSKRPLTPTELQEHLTEQIGFLQHSAAAFDAGFDGEAKRLAAVLRTLLHDTPQSHSLVGQLGKKDGDFLDTAVKYDPANLSSHGGLVFIAVGAPRTRYMAMLDDVPMTRFLPFSDWWNAPVFIDNARNILTRKDLVTIAANQDGGTHVDPALDERYDRLAHKNALGYMAVENGTARPMEGPEKAAIRQITHEVLKTLVAGYAKKPSHRTGVFAGGISVSVIQDGKGVIPMLALPASIRRRRLYSSTAALPLLRRKN